MPSVDTKLRFTQVIMKWLYGAESTANVFLIAQNYSIVGGEL